jgi:hypothetical protein
MFDLSLFQAVESFSRAALAQTDAALERPWAWGEYDSEGIRFAFFRVYEELCTQAVLTAAEGRPAAIPSVRRILALTHAAYRDLQAVLLGVDEHTAALAPAEGEWPIRQTLAHMIGADAGFFVLVKHSINQHRLGCWAFERVPDEVYDTVIGLSEAEFDAVLGGPLGSLQEFHDRLHARILDELSDIRDSELELPSRFWESVPMPLRFRLHRFDSHLRQHTIQLEKTLTALDRPPDEIHRLLRLIFAGLTEAEGAAYAAGLPTGAGWQGAAARISALAVEIS